MFLYYLPVVLIAVYYAVYYYFTRTYNYWKKRNVAGPTPVPFFGNLKEYTLRQKNMSLVMEEVYAEYPKEKVVGIFRMTTPGLLIRDLDIIKHIMIKDFDLFRDRGIDMSSKGLGKNLFHADSDTWSALRTRFTPIFTSGKLKNMFHLLSERSDVFVNYMEKKSQTDPEYNIHQLAQKYTVSTIFACAFGIDMDTFKNDIDDALKSVDNFALIPSYALEFDMMYPGILKKLDLSIFPVSVRDFFDKLVASIMQQRKGKPTERGDFMDLILQLQGMGEIGGGKNKGGTENKSLAITDDVIAAQAFVFYVAGYETSSTTMGYLLYQLALNPTIQEKLREDVDKAMKAHNGEITYDSIKDMKYLDKAFNETLRMYAIVDPLQRKALVDYKVPGTDVVVKKGQIVIVSVNGIHHDEKYYPNPEVFDPDRFEPELAGARHPCAYMPFGVGPRNCIGMRFGALQSRLAVAKIISKFRVETCAKTQMKLGIDPNRNLVGPAENIILNIVPRNS
ncbi:cytochrome P450 6B6-like [Anticarsia gemmatalis]|uniref:cytochrome P450 6B6-like n=1 Tax=Anticarsia gemmatalis TaxID=129554 RepID=UPI003F777B32